MPIGITTDVVATFCGAILGLLVGKKLPEYLKNALNSILGIAAITMGINMIIKVHTLSAVVLALILGCIVGELLHLEDAVNGGVRKIMSKIFGGKADEGFLVQLSVVVVLFCCSGTGWYGSLNEGLTGDGTILVTKSILDCITACIFGSLLGGIVPMLCIPQAVIFGALFLVSGLVQPYITPEMIADFSAAGGIITLCAGLRMTGIKRDLKLLNLLPTLIIVFFVSAAWTAVF